MRAVKILGLIVGGLVALVLLAVLAAWLLIDPNDYKNRIASSVKSSTGRELALPGDIKLSVFPWLALQVGPATLGNPPEFGVEPFAVVQRAALRVRLVPLLSGRLEIGRIEIDGLDLRLKQNAAGKGNWVFGDDSAAAQTPAEGTAQPLDLAGVQIKDSRISFDALVAQKVDIDVGRVAPGVAIPVKLQLELVSAPGATPLPLTAAFDLTMDPKAEKYRLAALDLAGTLTPKPGAAPVAWKFTAPAVSLDLAVQTLTAAQFAAQFASAKLAGSLDGVKIIDSPSLSGSFQLEPVNPRELLQQLAIDAPVTRDGKVLSSLAVSGAYTYAGSDARVEKLQAKLDDSSLEGRFALNLDSTAMQFDLKLDRIDLDRYLPPPSTAPASGKSEPFEVPVAALKPLVAKGELAIGQATIADVKLTNLRVGVDANAGVTRIAPARAQLYGGQYSGEITVDTRPAAPVLSIEQTMTGIDIAQLLTDFLESKRLSGKGNVSASLTGQGHNSDALIKTLKGKLTANLADGAVEGIDLWYAISQAQSLIQKRTLAGGINAKRTVFETFKVSADVNGGVASTSDLAITSQLLRVTGKGSSNLATQAIDYQVLATILKAPPQADESLAALTLAAIPVNITGTFENPKVRPDLEGLAKARLKQEVEKRKDKIEEKVKDKLQDKLKGLLNR